MFLSLINVTLPHFLLLTQGRLSLLHDKRTGTIVPDDTGAKINYSMNKNF